MKLSIGIVGLPNVGKSTLFNALTQNQAEASNYPFCTIDPNIGIVPVPDERLEKLAKVVNTQKIVPAVVQFVDIAGLVRGANKGEGLGNQFLAHIRECNAICEVIRDFTDSNIVHIEGKIHPESDAETIQTELILADLETVAKIIERMEKESKKDPTKKEVLSLAQKIQKNLEDGIPAREVDLTEKERGTASALFLLTQKPHFYILNVSEEWFKNPILPKLKGKIIPISAKIESELQSFSETEKKEYLAAIGAKDSGLNLVAKEAFDILNLIVFFTAGEKEARAWEISKGSKAPEAAGAIHTDFEKGFIKAEVVNWQDLVSSPGWTKAREQGKVRLEGKDYIVKEGDVMVFKFSN